MDSVDITDPVAVAVFYLTVSPHREGYAWAVRQYGARDAISIGTEAFDTEVAARKAGRPSLIAATARAKIGARPRSVAKAG